MTPKQISHLLTEDLQPGQSGLINEEGQFVIETNRGTKIVADYIEEDTEGGTTIVLAGIGPGTASCGWHNPVFKRKHPKFWRYDNSEWEENFKELWVEFTAFKEQAYKELVKQSAVPQAAPVELGAEDSLPDEDVFANPTGRDPLLEKAKLMARAEIKKKYNIDIALNRSQADAKCVYSFKTILTLNKQNISRISQGGKVLFQQTPVPPKTQDVDDDFVNR